MAHQNVLLVGCCRCRCDGYLLKLTRVDARPRPHRSIRTVYPPRCRHSLPADPPPPRWTICARRRSRVARWSRWTPPRGSGGSERSRFSPRAVSRPGPCCGGDRGMPCGWRFGGVLCPVAFARQGIAIVGALGWYSIPGHLFDYRI
jgi:hypothetical protein